MRRRIRILRCGKRWRGKTKHVLSAPKRASLQLPDRRDSEVLAAEAEVRGDVKAGTGADKMVAKYFKVQNRQIGRNLSGVNLPKTDEVLFFLSQKDINTFTLLLWIVGKMGGKLDELFLTTFNVNQKIIYAFARLIDEGKVDRLSIVLSQSIMSRMPERIEELRLVWEKRKAQMRVSLCWNHSKVLLARSGDKRFVLTGSGNFSFNAEIEQYEVWNNAELYDWNYKTLNRRCFDERGQKSHQVWGEDD